MQLTAEQEAIYKGHICPYCRRETIYTDSTAVYEKSYGMIYLCTPCNAYVGVHKGTDEALGRLANLPLRDSKKSAHFFFDKIWKEEHMTREEAYAWLSEKLGLPIEYTHIGMFGIVTCWKVVRLSKQYLSTKTKEKQDGILC